MKRTPTSTVPHLFIVDADRNYSISLKAFLESKLEEETKISIFADAEDCLCLMNGNNQQPDIIILDYSENKEFNTANGEHTVDYIKRIHPSTVIIMLSDEENAERAMKALEFGAHNFVIKNQFSNEHILSSVNKCLHPVKV